MLQISQTENPMCSATIDQMRLRLATTLPVEFQNVSSSGLQSEIQLWFGVLIRDFLSDRGVVPVIGIRTEAWRRAPGRPRSGVVAIQMIGFRWTAAMASTINYSSFVPSLCGAKTA